MAEPDIVVDKSAEGNGMAQMIAQLMRDNIASSTYKARCFKLLKATVAIDATDAEVTATLLFDRGSCVVYDGVKGKPDLRIKAESEAILELSQVSIVAGLPFYLNATGRGVLSKILLRDIRVEGMLFHPLSANLLTIVLSVN